MDKQGERVNDVLVDATVTVEMAAIQRALYGDDRRELLLAIEPEHFSIGSHAEAWRALRAGGMNGHAPDLGGIWQRVVDLWGVDAANRCLLVSRDDDRYVMGERFDHGMLASLVRHAAAQRMRKEAAGRLASGEASVASTELLRQADEIEAYDLAGGGTRANRLSKAMVSSVELARMPISKPESLMGDGVLEAGGFGLLFGQPGTFKSWLGFLLGRSLARGEPFLGVPVRQGGTPCAIIQLEQGAYRIQQRIRAMGIGSNEMDSKLGIVARPLLKGAMDLMRDGLAELRRMVDDHALRLVVLDAMSRFHTLDENDNTEIGKLMAGLDELRHTTGCAVFVIHHPRKGTPGGKDDDDDLDALRGSSRMESDTTLVMRVKKTEGHSRVLRWAKVSEGAEPEPIHFHLTDRGPEACDPPSAAQTKRGSRNRDAILEIIAGAQGGKISAKGVTSAAGMSKSTVHGHIDTLLALGKVQAEFMNGMAFYFVDTQFGSDSSDMKSEQEKF